ncbi:V-type ATP synthase subunit A [Thermobrachium celere]|uniref:V-type ATP synthase alpha chain n=1 Tax=Thermobrachium celere DSM 8682 TaxID=941824 RepID=R7RTI2_9CLOT|nr:V-type ATP synthase subunit A [Thermobrachium celere]CDF58578.1 V-type ATP synthase subunit A [Thermobrachium celere DSM 8682]
MEGSKGKVIYVNGPVVKAINMKDFKMREMVTVGEKKLIGEVISIDEDLGTIQVYEDTTGLKVGDDVISTQKPLSVTLGPGIVGNIFDGIQRPLNIIFDKSGNFIKEGIGLETIDKTKKWYVKFTVKEGEYLKGGDIFGIVEETPLIKHYLMVPPNVEGKILEIKEDGEYSLDTILIKLDNGQELKMYQEWPVRIPRPVKERLPIQKPLITGQRVIDTFFPIAKGGTAAIPGGFGTGKTMTQHQLAKWSDADIIVYIGCGERGNEMTEVLEDFPKLIDPSSNLPLMNRTILIANTSNMPVAAREASIYTGITIAEYFRDMGYNVAVMADSTSRWAEALREISGRLEEMPAEEGYPAYLPSRLAEFYERAGYVRTLNDKEASVTIIGAVSPAGGDFSEPVTQNTKRFVSAFLGLDRKLAYSRHYPAINWLSSYSGYITQLEEWYRQNVAEDMLNLRAEMMKVLQEESKLQETVKLVGEDVLPDEQRLILEIAKLIKVGYLQQNAYHKEDTFVPLNKQYMMLKVIYSFYKFAKEAVKVGVPISVIKNSNHFYKIIKMKYEIPNNFGDSFDKFINDISEYFTNLIKEYEGD